MAIKKILRNIWMSAKYRGSTAEKISAFATLSKLQVKRGINKKRNSKVKVDFLNYQFQGYDYRTIEHLFNEIFMSDEYYFESATPEPLIIDCGANIGMSILYFKSLYPGSRIIAFEANPYAFDLLEENVRENNLKDVELHNVALFDKETDISFFIGDNIGTLMGSVKKGRSGESEMTVAAKRLSDYLKSFEHIDLIKIDVEGAEINILTDLLESSSLNKANEYIIEYHHNMGSDNSMLSFFLKKFEEHGYNYNLRTNFIEIDTFQDILIHFYKVRNH
ncbi:FkbM family methyltransferase [Fulvivirga sedimenti]|uniref:FkbM family methyltransferase n=1 Tax=Fulvivirga sedimenti TaxID=2879465 RepID=A0A9X1KYY7_9BACT|nr:FkbM family methyltransferase [Fulvivirga sedimenti]MCA6074101.1 FkbM family methyltransferase [Fulvivirga sedimenti]